MRADSLPTVKSKSSLHSGFDGANQPHWEGGPFKNHGKGQNWQPIPVFLPGESHGRRSLASYRPQGRKELDVTEVTEQKGAVIRKEAQGRVTFRASAGQAGLCRLVITLCCSDSLPLSF